MEYVNTNLHSPIELGMIANHINVSKRQLLRIMYLHLNESLYAYITRLRMERAVLYMQIEKMSLTKLSCMVGYDNAQSFSKAFRRHFNISPKLYIQRLHDKLNEYAKHCPLKTKTMQSEEIYIDTDIFLVCTRIMGKYGDDEAYKKGWNRLISFLSKNKLLNESNRFIGISLDNPNITKTENCRFYACASIDNNRVTDHEFNILSIPKGKYAVYTLHGSYSQLQDLYNNIYLNLNSRIRYGLTFEEYINNPEDANENDLITKIYIPIK